MSISITCLFTVHTCVLFTEYQKQSSGAFFVNIFRFTTTETERLNMNDLLRAFKAGQIKVQRSIGTNKNNPRQIMGATS